jgi:hypothetical protein
MPLMLFPTRHMLSMLRLLPPEVMKNLSLQKKSGITGERKSDQTFERYI